MKAWLHDLAREVSPLSVIPRSISSGAWNCCKSEPKLYCEEAGVILRVKEARFKGVTISLSSGSVELGGMSISSTEYDIFRDVSGQVDLTGRFPHR